MQALYSASSDARKNGCDQKDPEVVDLAISYLTISLRNSVDELSKGNSRVVASSTFFSPKSDQSHESQRYRQWFENAINAWTRVDALDHADLEEEDEASQELKEKGCSTPVFVSIASLSNNPSFAHTYGAKCRYPFLRDVMFIANQSARHQNKPGPENSKQASNEL